MILTAALFTLSAAAKDWPMWRGNPARTAATSETLPTDLKMNWQRKFSPRIPVWDDPLNQALMAYDTQFEPIIIGRLLIVGFNDRDKVVAFDLTSGKTVWQHFCDGAVRMPPCADENGLYITDDSGVLTSLNPKTGKVQWQFNGTPSKERILANKRMSSAWPARGGAVVTNNRVYFSCSIWPFMGTFIYAIDTKTGQKIWVNSGTGADFQKQPHDATSFAGIAPQGKMAISGNTLLVPGGRTIPGSFNATTGELNYFHLAKYKKTGGDFIAMTEKGFFNHDRDFVCNFYETKDGHVKQNKLHGYPAIDGEFAYFSGTRIKCVDANKPGKTHWRVQDIDATGDLIKAGNFLYAGGKDKIIIVELNGKKEAKKIKELKVTGQVKRLIAGNGHLVAVTAEGSIITFAKNGGSKTIDESFVKTSAKPSTITRLANKSFGGYGVVYGAGDGRLLEQLASETKLKWIVIENDTKLIKRLRYQLDRKGIFATKIDFVGGDFTARNLPQYFSSFSIINNPKLACNSNFLRDAFKTLRPYGGQLLLNSTKAVSIIKSLKLSNAKLKKIDGKVLLIKPGAPVGSANWTHQYGDLTNRSKSDDKLVKLPLGLLWFGGNSNLDVLPRHGHGPPEQVVNGHLVIRGMAAISARDVYTGRLLWKNELKLANGEGIYFDGSYKDTPLSTQYNQLHLPGANARGTDFVVTKEAVYVIVGSQCNAYSLKTGKLITEFKVPAHLAKKGERWAFLGVYGRYLIGGAGFVNYVDFLKGVRDNKRGTGVYNFTASKGLFVYDRFTKKEVWSKTAKLGFLHNAIVVHNNIITCLDKLPYAMINRFERRGLSIPKGQSMTAFNLKTGKKVWSNSDPKEIFGSMLVVEPNKNLLLQATRPSRDMLAGEDGRRMSLFNLKTGKKLWDKEMKYSNPPIWHRDWLITDSQAFMAKDGSPVKIKNLLTGKESPWTYRRSYGCNTSTASENLIMFRSGAAGFYDLDNMGGTGNFGGFKSGCTSNLVAADGVLNAPDYTRTCSCSYQNQTSLALVHWPHLEYWTENHYKWSGEAIKAVGINFGAPGDRVDEKTLWLDYPSVGGKSPNLPIKTKGDLQIFRAHGYESARQEKSWILNSGVTGLKEFEIELDKSDRSKNYSVTLFLKKQDGKTTPQAVYVQDKKISAKASEIVIKNVKVKKDLKVRLESPNGTTFIKGLKIVKE